MVRVRPAETLSEKLRIWRGSLQAYFFPSVIWHGKSTDSTVLLQMLVFMKIYQQIALFDNLNKLLHQLFIDGRKQLQSKLPV